VQQIVLEQMDFFKAKNIKHGKQAAVLLCNAMIFFCQYRAVAKLAEVGYPGFSTGGMLWFMDLTQADYILPIFAALMFHLAVRVSYEKLKWD
jgi:membrane protein insertase Oxa1/YidC/SpoIIIJ